jgi:hypothetical protein
LVTDLPRFQYPASLLLQGVATCFFGFPTAPYFLLLLEFLLLTPGLFPSLPIFLFELCDMIGTAEERTDVTFYPLLRAVFPRLAAVVGVGLREFQS